MNLKFNDTSEYKSGAICSLLAESYAEIIDQKLKEQFLQFDREVFEKPETVGACTFIAALGADVIGMASYDPRRAPELGIIGHNCILPKYRRKGYGRQQILEIIRRLKAIGVRLVAVSTSEHSFFMPARKMYLSCGFSELEKRQKNPHDVYERIYYEIKLKN
ncbi:MAG: GNAT family N-acetyltransferase [Sedimentisphaerales bacterium]|nr:GNAT family N-acetyltransferase [Sedimentisphaerales bacterium]